MCTEKHMDRMKRLPESGRLWRLVPGRLVASVTEGSRGNFSGGFQERLWYENSNWFQDDNDKQLPESSRWKKALTKSFGRRILGFSRHGTDKRLSIRTVTIGLQKARWLVAYKDVSDRGLQKARWWLTEISEWWLTGMTMNLVESIELLIPPRMAVISAF